MHNCKFVFVLILTAFAFFVTQSAHAITPADIAANYQYHEAKISPDGKYIALTLVHDGKRRLAVIDAKKFTPVGGADFGGKQEVGDFYWVNNERLVIKVLQHMPWQEQPGYYGELFAINYDGSRSEMIYGYRASDESVGTRTKKKKATFGWANIISLLPDDDKHILISSRPMMSDGLVTTVHKLNVYNGRMSGVIAGAPSAYGDFVADRQGNLKLSTGLNANGDIRVFLFNEQKQDWQELASNKFGQDFEALRLDESGENLFVLDNYQQDKTGLFKLNLKTGVRQSVYTDDTVDITAVTFSSDLSSVYALRVDPDYPTYVMFNNVSEEAKLYKQLLQSFPGYKLTITSRSRDGNAWLIYASNDVFAGSYYLFNRDTGQFSLLFNNFKHIPPEQMSESIPVSFEASDGLVIRGYITYPAGIPETQATPLVTLVHGGPHSRDYWSFDREVQLLASQGYAVLRLNFRGSSGYGASFQQASQKSWGDRMQLDIIQGTQWAISQGGIDPEKVCIMGASFGGYSAMQSATLAPDLFKCVVANVGVYDLEMMFEKGDIPDLLFGKSYLEQELGVESDMQRKHSPVNNLDSLKASVLVAHGAKDRRVPIEQAETLLKALKQRNLAYQTFIKDTETHGFYGEQNRTEYYQAVVDFLEQHLQ